MDLSIEADSFGRLVCTINDEGSEAVVTASDSASAAAGLLGAVQDAEEGGYGECLWREATGEYRWMFRREGDRLTVVVLWSIGTVTGWQHVVHTQTDARSFAARVRSELARAAEAPRSR